MFPGERDRENGNLKNWHGFTTLRGALRFYQDLNKVINFFGLEITLVTSSLLSHYQEQTYNYALRIGNQDMANSAKIMALTDASITVACAVYGFYRLWRSSRR